MLLLHERLERSTVALYVWMATLMQARIGHGGGEQNGKTSGVKADESFGGMNG